jgi:hypothetical protein
MNTTSKQDELFDALSSEISCLLTERDELEFKLGPLAYSSEISGMSWSGFNVIGDKKSINEVKRILHRSAQLEEFQKSFDDRVASIERERDEARADTQKLFDAMDEYGST